MVHVSFMRKSALICSREKKIFNYKLSLTNSIPSPIHLNKWIFTVNKLCDTGKTLDTIEHSIFNCVVCILYGVQFLNVSKLISHSK